MKRDFCSHEHKSNLRIELILGTKIRKTGNKLGTNWEQTGNDILEGILRLFHTNLLILIIKYITQVTEECIHNAGVGGSSPPVATNISPVTNMLIPSRRSIAKT